MIVVGGIFLRAHSETKPQNIDFLLCSVFIRPR